MGVLEALVGRSLLLGCALGLRVVQRDAEPEEAPHSGPADYESWPLWEPGHVPGQRLASSAGAEYFLPLEYAAEVQSTPVGQTLAEEAKMTICMAKGRCCMNFTHTKHDERRSWGYGAFQVGNVAEPALTPFIVPEDQPNRTDVAVVVVPGGGPHHIAWEGEGADAARWLNSLGISAFVLRYRTSPDDWEQHSQIMDVQRAVSIVRSKAASLGLNVSRIGLFGASYGGELATFAGAAKLRLYEADSRDHELLRPDFNILLYPTFPDEMVLGTPEEQEESAKRWNSTLVPPTFVVSAANDPCVNSQEIINLHRVLHRGGRNATELHFYPSGGHAFGFCYRRGKAFAQKHEVCMWTKRAENFLNRYILHRPDEAAEEFYWRLRGLIGGPDKNESA